jgi:hypothetical protein
VFPLFLRARNALRPQGIVLALGATALMVFGLYSTIRNQLAT